MQVNSIVIKTEPDPTIIPSAQPFDGVYTELFVPQDKLRECAQDKLSILSYEGEKSTIIQRLRILEIALTKPSAVSMASVDSLEETSPAIS